MISQITRKQAWDEYWNAERMVRYCEMIHEWHQRRYIIFTVVMAVSLCGGVIAIIVKFPVWVQLAFNAVIAITSICSFVLNDAKKAAIIHTLNVEILWIYDEYKTLWLRIENHQIDNNDILTRLEELRNYTSDAQKAVGNSDILRSQKKNKKAEQQATNAMNNRYCIAM